jgi:PAS domain S-box-containing protein
MNTLQMLTIRHTAALGRLATLQRRAERLPAPAASVTSAALHELKAALEEIQVATDQMQSQANELAAVRDDGERKRRQFAEFVEQVPVPCVWTGSDGEIDQANTAAAELLNVSAPRLCGRPLMLFVTERERFTESIGALNQDLARTVDLQVLIRPRERRPRPVRLVGKRLAHDQRRCWFLIALEATTAKPVAPEASESEDRAR